MTGSTGILNETRIRVGKTKEDIVDEMLLLFMAGHDTTGNTLAMIFYELARHPQIQQQARASCLRLKEFDERQLELRPISI